ncbi:DUF6935 domain-containing protein [Leptospira sp. GIMC2001]|uniref:DUF6935 domain-containing protein n=1 Tax=Leptospira sp. GIMC2001 TaxID=1513297 RepID=UPI00234AAD86|nr:hypothetical protein [Leptospira sp. GIMC2001]WCL50152.1 hypothetical protein O4O04_04860 [Leptospira sp. GIMC2001]
MKKLLSVLAILAITTPIFSQEGNYDLTVNSWPTNLAEFDVFRTENSSNPQGAVVSLIAALDIFVKNEEDGRKALVLILDSGSLSQDTSGKGYKGFNVSRSTMDLVKRQLSQNPALPGSYLPGSSTQNGYTPSPPPYTFNLTANRYSGEVSKGAIKLFVPCSGASSARPVSTKVNSKGAWKITEFSSLLVGVAKPANQPNPADDL